MFSIELGKKYETFVEQNDFLKSLFSSLWKTDFYLNLSSVEYESKWKCL